MTKVHSSFIARNINLCAYVGLFLALCVVNVYTHLISQLEEPLESTWTIVFFVSILYIAPFAQWKKVIFSLLICHVFWQLLLHPGQIDWPLMLIELGAGLVIAFYAKYFNSNWQPSDFNSKILTYLPGMIPTYLVYIVCVILRDWELHNQSATTFMFGVTFFLQHAHLLEFIVGVSVTFLILCWYSQNFALKPNIYLLLIAFAAHAACLYFWPHNLIPLTITMTASIFYIGLQGVAVPSFIFALAMPFILVGDTTLLQQVNQLSYAFLILCSCVIGLMLQGFVAAVKQGVSYRLVLSKVNPIGLIIGPLEVDNLRSQLQEKNQQISQAYAALEQTNDNLKTLTASLETQTQAYKKMAEIDQLTGLKSRHYFYNYLTDGSRSHSYCLLLIDLDNFKSVNDIYGHDTGDEILKACARVLSNASIHHGFAARVGGEEFCIALANIDLNAGQKMADELGRKLGKSTILKADVIVSRTASIGVAELNKDATLKHVMRLADEALYVSKSKGKDTTTVADEAFMLESKNNQKNLSANDLLEGLSNNEFYLYLQPICSNISGQAVGFEALMRWHRPDGSILSPDRFLELAISPPVYAKFKDVYIAQLIPIVKTLTKLNCDYYLSFNTEATFIHSSQMVNHFIRQFQEANIKPKNLVLELPEKAAILNTKKALSNIKLLQNSGIGIALDDFGMEHSNIDRIRDIPADIVKIDRSFISKIDQNPRSLAIVNALVTMSEQLKFQIIAEGIETQAQATILAKSGITRAQGYFYGRPKPLNYWLEQIAKGKI
ncbi:MAG: EAL domain-containing protein [Oceanospirillaceae bacterium]|nr:EAL domain-containing protein [Oceanospirillaceae bacterium]